MKYHTKYCRSCKIETKHNIVPGDPRDRYDTPIIRVFSAVFTLGWTELTRLVDGRVFKCQLCGKETRKI